MFNQQVLILYAIALSPFPLMYIGIKAFEWLQKNLFYSNQDNEQIGREGLMIQLEEVRKQRDEIATQLMIFRLQSQKANSNEPEPKGYKEFDDFLRKENDEIKGMVIELDKAYSESQRELRELRGISTKLIEGFEYNYDDIVDCTQQSFIETYKAFKSVLGQV